MIIINIEIKNPGVARAGPSLPYKNERYNPRHEILKLLQYRYICVQIIIYIYISL